jgi:hypothetical protein
VAGTRGAVGVDPPVPLDDDDVTLAWSNEPTT